MEFLASLAAGANCSNRDSLGEDSRPMSEPGARGRSENSARQKHALNADQEPLYAMKAMRGTAIRPPTSGGLGTQQGRRT